MPGMPGTFEGREIPDHADHDPSGIPPVPCLFCGHTIRHVNDGGIGWLLGAVVGGVSLHYLRCVEGPCARASAPWVWRCGCIADHVENVGDRCHCCWRPRAEALPYDQVECPVCGEARSLDDRRGIGNGRCLSCPGGLAYLPVLHEVPDEERLAILPGGVLGESVPIPAHLCVLIPFSQEV